MEVILAVVFGFLGAAIGSFLNVCIDRIPAGKSLLNPPSHCDACGHRLGVKDLIPVFSYLWLRRHCRYCRATIPWRLLWVEIGSGLLLAFVYWRYGLSVDFVITAGYCYLFIVLMVIDLEHKLILNKIVYPAMIVALLISILLPLNGILLPQSRIVSLPWPQAVDGVIGGAIGFLFLLIPALIYRGGMGWGDVKMAGLIGLVTGFLLVFVAMLMGVILGGLVAGILLVLRKKKRKEPIPFGPFLAVATIVALLWGNNILSWYLGLM
jgi:leader peptidase (prepilin peptidase)/N-methyltransferase